MKKFIAVFLILLLVAASASAAEWEEGFGPNNPYEGMPEIDFEKNIGYMMFHPNSAMSVSGTNVLFIYMPREDVTVGEGTLTLYSTDLGEEFSVSMNDADHVLRRAMLEIELQDLMWGSGTCFEIFLPVSLRTGATYYVNLERDCIVDEARPIGNGEIRSDARSNWYFTMVADYGVSAMEYRRPTGENTYENAILVPQAGDELRFDLVIGGDVKSATIVVPQEAMDDIYFDTTYFTESCEVIGHVTGDTPVWDILFWDSEKPSTDLSDVIDWLEF